MKRTSVPTLERPLHLLQMFTEEQPSWTLSDLARASGLPKASCLRALKALLAYGLLRRDRNSYELGSALLTLGNLAMRRVNPRRVAWPELQRLGALTEKSVQWVVRDEGEGIFLEVIEPKVHLRLYVKPGRRAPLYAGASTRLLLAFASQADINSVLASKKTRYTNATPVNNRTLRSLIRVSALTWFAASFGELEPGSAELAAPVMGASGEAIASISVAFTEQHYAQRANVEHDLRLLDAAAQEISRSIGYAGPWGSDLATFLGHLYGRQARS